MFSAIPFVPDSHYATACRWWKAHGWKEPPGLGELTPHGIVVEYKGVPAAMSWIHLSHNRVSAWMSWVVTERMLESDVKDMAIKHLIDSCELLVRGLGYKQMFTTQRVPKLVRRFEARGFRIGDSRMTNLFKELV